MIHLKPEFFLMFFHYSIILKIYKKKKDKSKQSDFDNFFFPDRKPFKRKWSR